MKKIVITESQIIVTGFDNTEFHKDDLGSCRDVGRSALAWGAGRLADDLYKDATGRWDEETTAIGDEESDNAREVLTNMIIRANRNEIRQCLMPDELEEFDKATAILEI